MERESFEDEDVAAILNRNFVAIKVDREERPDVDHIYMSVCQALTGQGGWPLTVIMTPEKTPFFAGTYFPKSSKWGRPGLLELLSAVQERWRDHRQDVLNFGEEIAGILRKQEQKPRQGQLSPKILEDAFGQLVDSFEKQYGGFSPAPKFPTPHTMMFLLRYWYRTRNPKALTMVEKTLQAMQQGGIYDHIGYGFARYSTDEKWLVPHFEKMLYDNALLCCTYLEAYQCTGKSEYAQIADEILTYVLREMTDGQGGFYSAEDADSEGEEGKFYVFTRKEIISVLGEERGRIFADYYHVTLQGNFEHGTNILNTIDRDSDDFAVQAGISKNELAQLLCDGRTKLFQYREQRVHPYKDDKILTAWNGLMIVAFAKAGRILDSAAYAEAAQRGLQFIMDKLIDEDGRLLARFRQGEAAHRAYLDDYAFLLWALLELYETVFSPAYLKWALELCAELKRLFWDEENGGFFFYGTDGEQLIARTKDLYDGAIPSGNSVAALALLKLARMTEKKELMDMANRQIQIFSAEAGKYPKAFTFYMMALEYYWAPYRKIAIAGPKESADTWTMLTNPGRYFLPNTSVTYHDADQLSLLADILPDASQQLALGGRPTAYICENFTCRAPVTDLSSYLNDLQQAARS